MIQRLTEYIGESVSMKKRIGIGQLQKSRASQINYIEGVYHGIVRISPTCLEAALNCLFEG